MEAKKKEFYFDTLKENLPQTLLILIGLYIILSVIYYWFQQYLFIAGFGFFTSIIFLILYFILLNRAFSDKQIKVIIALIGCLIIANSSVRLYLTQDIHHSLSFVLIVISCGLLLFSKCFYWIFLIIAVCSWLSIFSMLEAPPEQKVHYTLVMFISTVISYLTFNMREKSYLKIETLNWIVESSNKELKDALQETRTAKRECHKLRHVAMEESRLKSQFVANMSHEIRTPLNAVIAISDLLSESKKKNGQQNQYVQMIREAGDNLLYLINNVLDISKIQAGEFFIGDQAFYLRKLIDEIVKPLQVQVKAKKIKLKVDLKFNIENMLKGDPYRIKQVLNNLMNNAMKFTKQRGTITLKVETIESTPKNESVSIRFSVQDTGEGVPANKQQAIFEQYIQSDNTISKRVGGTGLGLAISKKIVAAMNGRIGIKSPVNEDPLHPGSEFWIELLFKIVDQDIKDSSENTERAKPSKQRQKVKRTHTPKVLVAEDNEVNQLLIKTLLQKRKLKVFIVPDGESAIKVASIGKYDLIFMDISMPGIDGYEAAKTLRNKNVKTPIVALTAHAFEENKLKAFESGMDDFLTKPFRKKDIDSIFDKWIYS